MSSSLLLFLDISGGEFLIILLVAFFVFGPRKLPEIARKLGRTMNEIKSVSGELTREFKDETRNITSELRNARESARINAENLELNKIIDPATDKKVSPVRKKMISTQKPPADVDVTNDSNNNEHIKNVNGQNEITK